MSKFEFVKDDGTTLDFSTTKITVEKQVPMLVSVSLWESIGKHIPYAQLAEVGLKVKYTPTQSQARMEYEKITFMYNQLPEFAAAVSALQGMYDELGVTYNCTVEDIETKLLEKYTDLGAQATWLAKFNATLDKGVALNYQSGNRMYYEENSDADIEFDPVDDFIVWQDFPKLVKWLPGTYSESDIPIHREEEIITTDAREAEIKPEEETNL